MQGSCTIVEGIWVEYKELSMRQNIRCTMRNAPKMPVRVQIMGHSYQVSEIKEDNSEYHIWIRSHNVIWDMMKKCRS